LFINVKAPWEKIITNNKEAKKGKRNFCNINSHLPFSKKKKKKKKKKKGKKRKKLTKQF